MCCLRVRQIGWVPFDRYRVRFDFRCKDKRKDPDNILGGIKYLLDGIVQAEIVAGDRWANVLAIETIWAVDRDEPGVLVTLEEV
jgi:hypothetical protein